MGRHLCPLERLLEMPSATTRIGKANRPVLLRIRLKASGLPKLLGLKPHEESPRLLLFVNVGRLMIQLLLTLFPDREGLRKITEHSPKAMRLDHLYFASPRYQMPAHLQRPAGAEVHEERAVGLVLEGLGGVK